MTPREIKQLIMENMINSGWRPRSLYEDERDHELKDSVRICLSTLKIDKYQTMYGTDRNGVSKIVISYNNLEQNRQKIMILWPETESELIFMALHKS